MGMSLTDTPPSGNRRSTEVARCSPPIRSSSKPAANETNASDNNAERARPATLDPATSCRGTGAQSAPWVGTFDSLLPAPDTCTPPVIEWSAGPCRSGSAATRGKTGEPPRRLLLRSRRRRMPRRRRRVRATVREHARRMATASRRFLRGPAPLPSPLRRQLRGPPAWTVAPRPAVRAGRCPPQRAGAR